MAGTGQQGSAWAGGGLGSAGGGIESVFGSDTAGLSSLLGGGSFGADAGGDAQGWDSAPGGAAGATTAGSSVVGGIGESSHQSSAATANSGPSGDQKSNGESTPTAGEDDFEPLAMPMACEPIGEDEMLSMHMPTTFPDEMPWFDGVMTRDSIAPYLRARPSDDEIAKHWKTKPKKTYAPPGAMGSGGGGGSSSSRWGNSALGRSTSGASASSTAAQHGSAGGAGSGSTVSEQPKWQQATRANKPKGGGGGSWRDQSGASTGVFARRDESRQDKDDAKNDDTFGGDALGGGSDDATFGGGGTLGGFDLGDLSKATAAFASKQQLSMRGDGDGAASSQSQQQQQQQQQQRHTDASGTAALRAALQIGGAAGSSPDGAAMQTAAPAPAQAPAPAPVQPQPQPELHQSPVSPGMEPSSDEPQWFYQDNQKVQQGPFAPSDMRQWLDANYFKPDLPIRHASSPEGVFVALQDAFPSMQSAFIGLGSFAPPRRPEHATEQQRQAAHQQLQQVQQNGRGIQARLEQLGAAVQQVRGIHAGLQEEQRADTQLVQTYRAGAMQLQQATEEARSQGDQGAVARCDQEMASLKSQAAELAQRLRNRKAQLDQAVAKEAELMQAGRALQQEMVRVTQDIRGLNLVIEGHSPDRAMEILKSQLQAEREAQLQQQQQRQQEAEQEQTRQAAEREAQARAEAESQAAEAQKAAERKQQEELKQAELARQQLRETQRQQQEEERRRQRQEAEARAAQAKAQSEAAKQRAQAAKQAAEEQERIKAAARAKREAAQQQQRAAASKGQREAVPSILRMQERQEVRRTRQDAAAAAASPKQIAAAQGAGKQQIGQARSPIKAPVIPAVGSSASTKGAASAKKQKGKKQQQQPTGTAWDSPVASKPAAKTARAGGARPLSIEEAMRQAEEEAMQQKQDQEQKRELLQQAHVTQAKIHQAGWGGAAARPAQVQDLTQVMAQQSRESQQRSSTVQTARRQQAAPRTSWGAAAQAGKPKPLDQIAAEQTAVAHQQQQQRAHRLAAQGVPASLAAARSSGTGGGSAWAQKKPTGMAGVKAGRGTATVTRLGRPAPSSAGSAAPGQPRAAAAPGGGGPAVGAWGKAAAAAARPPASAHALGAPAPAPAPAPAAAAQPKGPGLRAMHRGPTTKSSSQEAGAGASSGGSKARGAVAGLGGVSGKFRDWATGRMKEISGDDQGLLFEFIVALSSPTEVRDYCEDCLGRSHAVDAFVTEFLSRREFEGGNAQPAGKRGRRKGR